MVIRDRDLRTRLVWLALALLLALPAAAQAQSKDEPSSWGVGVSFAPLWRAHEQFQKIFIIEESDQLLEGSEFSIGLARGRKLGGYWTVGFVSKPFKNVTVSQTEEFSETNQFGTFFNRFTTTTTFRDVRFKGIEAVKYFALATIKQRAQIGLTVGGGIGFPEGTVETVEVSFNRNTPNQGPVNESTEQYEETLPANEYFFKYQPLFKIEIQGAAILMPGLKATVAWGINNPGKGVRVGAVYLFGAK